MTTGVEPWQSLEPDGLADRSSPRRRRKAGWRGGQRQQPVLVQSQEEPQTCVDVDGLTQLWVH